MLHLSTTPKNNQCPKKNSPLTLASNKNSCQTNSSRPSNFIISGASQIYQKASEKSLHNKSISKSNTSLSNFDLRHSELDQHKHQFESIIVNPKKVDSLKSLKKINNCSPKPPTKANISVSKHSMEKIVKQLSKSKKSNISAMIGTAQSKVKLINATLPMNKRKMVKQKSKNDTLSSDSAKQLKSKSSKIFNSNSSHELEYKIRHNITTKPKQVNMNKMTASDKQLRKENSYSKGSTSQRVKYSTLSSYSGREESKWCF